MNKYESKPDFIAQDVLLDQDRQLELNRLRARQLQRKLSETERQRLVELQQDENLALDGRKSETTRNKNAV